ncbi:protein-arginine deiminase family protein [Halobacteriovorax sp. HLS]|uniref:protein-arginine deiminase family protein n=1 Tax=Halobacteriovorax sp. HLS TaxID=2234000 RepID=UPI000FDA381B|nr:protein-arginine deiminase family protein [Halobacteriovorax sp. HLS]
MPHILIILFFLILSPSSIAGTNLGTITSVKNGFATIKECSVAEEVSLPCRERDLGVLSGILDQVSTNQCITSSESYKNLPKCPQGEDQVKGLDNTYPSGGVFVTYLVENAGFVKHLTQQLLEGDELSKVNIVIPQKYAATISEHPDLVKVINNPRVNVIISKTSVATNLWMQDYFQFTSVNGKPAIYQLEHIRESGMSLEARVACEIAKSCNLPYFIPPDMVKERNKDARNMNAGGNLEVLPGGTFLRGVQKRDGYQRPNSSWGSFAETKTQRDQEDALEDSKNRVLDLDISFVQTGHIDELFNVVKTNAPAPCNYAILASDPKLAVEILEKEAAKKREISKNCSDFDYEKLKNKFNKVKGFSKTELANIYASQCINGQDVKSFVSSKVFSVLKRVNVEQSDSNYDRQRDNIKDLVKELKKTTKCNEPKIISVPVLFRDGFSYTPELTNGVIQTPESGASRAILPRTYFGPFDQYIEKELKKYGVETTLVNDLNYHLNSGEVHCGTNTARVCHE